MLKLMNNQNNNNNHRKFNKIKLSVYYNKANPKSEDGYKDYQLRKQINGNYYSYKSIKVQDI